MEIEEKLESIDTKIETYNKKTDKLSKLVNTLVTSLEENKSSEITNQIVELKDAISEANNTFVSLSENTVNKNDINNLYNLAGDINVDVKKISGLVDEFKNSTDLSNHTISDNMEKIENLLTSYNNNLAEINSDSSTEIVTNAVKELNDKFYFELIKLLDSLSFEEEAEDLKDFMAEIISEITVKADENSEKLNSIMLQFKSLLHKIDSIEKAQNSISDYLKPEEADDLVYSFDDIQSDMAKMRLVLNDISNSVSSPAIVEEISEKLRKTGEQIDNISQLLGKNEEEDGKATDIREKIESLNSQIYDISLRTNKLLLSNEDSTIELKNNLELFKEVFDKANPEKLYELFYELTHYFNDVNEKIVEVNMITKASHNEAVTIKNALTYVGEWLDNATNVLEELKTNTSKPKENNNKALIAEIENIKKSQKEDVTMILGKIQMLEDNTNNKLNAINEKLDKILLLDKTAEKPAVKTTKSRTVKKAVKE